MWIFEVYEENALSLNHNDFSWPEPIKHFIAYLGTYLFRVLESRCLNNHLKDWDLEVSGTESYFIKLFWYSFSLDLAGCLFRSCYGSSFFRSSFSAIIGQWGSKDFGPHSYTGITHTGEGVRYSGWREDIWHHWHSCFAPGNWYNLTLD